MRISVILLSTIIFAAQLHAQIFSNPIIGTNPSTANPYTAGQTVAANITVSGIGRGSGITANTGNNRYNARSWSLLPDANTFFEFTLTPNSGYYINFSSFEYTGQVSLLGPTLFLFRSSRDGFATDIGSPTGTGTTISLSAPAYQLITTATTFRLYAFGAFASAATFSVDDFSFNGTVNPLIILPLQNIILTVNEGSAPRSAVLDWTTVQDVNQTAFVVEYSPTGHTIDFIPLDTLSASNPTNNYSYTARNLPVSKQLYFRLRVMFKDGSYAYTTIKTVNTAGSSVGNMSLYPNPATNQAVISWNAAKTNLNTHILLIDASGRLAASYTQNAVRGYNTTILSLSHLQKGMYLVKLDSDGETMFQRLMIQ